MVDPYVDPATGVLRNLLGVDDEDQLASLEAELAAIRLAELARRPVLGGYDLAHLCAFHSRIFQDVYGWAGALRTVNISKAAVPFCSSAHINAEADRIFGLMRRLEPVPDDIEAVTQASAQVLGEINALHPFREGNGRTQRAFLRQWLLEYGWVIDWSGLDPQANNDACEVALIAVDHGPLAELIRPRVSRKS